MDKINRQRKGQREGWVFQRTERSAWKRKVKAIRQARFCLPYRKVMRYWTRSCEPRPNRGSLAQNRTPTRTTRRRLNGMASDFTGASSSFLAALQIITNLGDPAVFAVKLQ